MQPLFEGEGTLASRRVLRLRVRFASADKRTGLPSVRLRPLGRYARQCHGGRQDAGHDLGNPQAQEPQGSAVSGLSERERPNLENVNQSLFLVEGDATKHFSVKKEGFSVKRGEAIQ